MIKAVIIGFSHMHVNEIAKYIFDLKDMELVGAASVPSGTENIPSLRYTPGWNLENIRDNYCSNIYYDYKKMLDELKPDIAFILSENCQKIEIANEVAKRGINLCIEKPAAMTYEEAIEIERIVEKYNVEAMVNWPVIWRPYILKMEKALDAKIVGEPVKLRYINGHTGPLGKGARHRGVSATAEEMTDEQRSKTWWHKLEFGGGVFLDICCYGCFFSDWFMTDEPKSIYSYGTNLNTGFGDTEDNFAAIIKYEGAMSVIEGTWTTPRAAIPSGPMVLCTNGIIMCTGGAENEPDVKAYDIYGNEVEMPKYDFEEKYNNMPCHYTNHILTGEPLHKMVTLKENVRVMKLLDGAIKSSAKSQEISL